MALRKTLPPDNVPRLILVLIWGLATGLNLFKPFHIDDTAGLLIAEAIIRAPLHPMGEMLNWLDTTEPIFTTNQPHLFFYLMAGTMALFGTSELALHLMLSLFSLVAIFSIHGLYHRFIRQHALWASVVSILGPGFLINQNVMTDIPLLALISLAALLMTRGRAALGFAVFSLALLTKYTALFLVPAMLWGGIWRWRGLVWAGLPVLALLGWSLLNLYDYGAVHILNRPSNVGGLMPSPKLAFALVCNLGLIAGPAALFLMVRSLVWLGVWMIGVALFFAAEIIGLGLPFQGLMLPNALLFASAFLVLIVAGLRGLSRLGVLIRSRGAFRETDAFWDMFLAIWLLGGLGFLATFPPFMASRHVLLLMPPLLILALGGVPSPPPKPLAQLIASVWAIFGVAVMASDISFARFYRDMAPAMAARAAQGIEPGNRVYFRGHWGWQWYARQAGMLEFDSQRTNLLPGDFLVDPVGISSQAVPEIETFEEMTETVQPRSPLTWLDTHRFYASRAQALPVISPAPARTIRILRKGP